MDAGRFDVLTRSLAVFPSRRDVLRGLAGGGLGFSIVRPPDGTEAKHKRKKKQKKETPQTPSPPATTCTPRCGRKVCGDDRCGGSCGSCAAGQSCISGTCCTPEPVATTCAGRCGTVTTIKTCHQPVACSCPGGQECLGNGSCAAVCGASTTVCPVNGFCSCVFPSVEGPHHCSGGIGSCEQF